MMMRPFYDHQTGRYVWRNVLFAGRLARVVPPSVPSWHKTREQFRKLLHRLYAFELNETKCRRWYILGSNEITSLFHRNLSGCFDCHFAWSYRKDIERTQKWKGLGPAFLVENTPAAVRGM